MHKSELIPAIYISYAWNPQSEAVAISVEKEFQKRNVRIIRDKNDLGYKGRIKEFMEQIGRGKYVILVISNKYLRSENCMFELLQIFKNQNFYERIFPVVLDEVNIAKASDRLDLVKYWEDEAENLDKKIRELKELANIQGVADDLNLYTEIRNNIARLTHILKDINTLNTNQHIKSDFKQLCDLVEQKIQVDFGKTKNTMVTKWSMIGLMSLTMLFLAFQVRNNGQLYKRNGKRKDSVAISKVRMDSLKDIKKKDALRKDVGFKAVDDKPIIHYVARLVVPSYMNKGKVYVDGKPAEIINRNLISIKVRLRKKASSHHFEIREGEVKCDANYHIIKNNMRLTLCD